VAFLLQQKNLHVPNSEVEAAREVVSEVEIGDGKVDSPAQVNWHMHMPEGRSMGKMANKTSAERTMGILLLRIIDA
jgi:hypothetical protein